MVHLPPLAGVGTVPLLSAEGGVRVAEGYDHATGLWCCGVSKLMLPARPSPVDVEAALGLLRQTFRTFPFGDAPRRWDASLAVGVIDITKPPGLDESVFLVALLTAVCRPSLWLAPGMLVTARRFQERAAARVCWSERSARSRSAYGPARSPQVASDRNSTSDLRPN